MPGAEKPLNAFETLTLVPIDQRLIEPSLLTADEAAWMDAYHARVHETIAPLVDVDDPRLAARGDRPIGAGRLERFLCVELLFVGDVFSQGLGMSEEMSCSGLFLSLF